MKYPFKHKLKRLLIKFKLWKLILPFYRKLIRFSLNYKKESKRLIKFYSQFIKPGDLCFDIGAHAGDMTEIFVKLGAKVVTIEPQSECIKYFKEKFKKNPKVIVIEKGVANQEGKLRLFISEESSARSTFSKKNMKKRCSILRWNKEKIVPVTTLDNLIKEFGLPKYCKIDVEGFEYRVLKGLTQLIPYISFQNNSIDGTKKCLNYLSSLGYKQFNANFGGTEELSFPEWMTTDELFKKNLEFGDEFLRGYIHVRFLKN